MPSDLTCKWIRHRSRRPLESSNPRSSSSFNTQRSRIMSQENKALVRRAIEEVHNRGNLAAIVDYVATDFVMHMPSAEIHGPAGARPFVAMLREAFPDFHMT